MKTSTHKLHREQVQVALRYVRDGLDPSQGVGAVAKAALGSRFHVHRIFQRLTGTTPESHVRSFRLTRAATDLRSTDLPIKDIAEAAGYANHESFTRAFRRKHRVTPTEYRTMKTLDIRVGLIKIPVSNFQQARVFYRDTLGLPEEFAVDQYGWAQYATGNLPLCLYLAGQGGGKGTPGGERDFHLTVSNGQAAHDLIQERGGAPEAIVRSDDGGLFFYITDPSGNRFKVSQAV